MCFGGFGEQLALSEVVGQDGCSEGDSILPKVERHPEAALPSHPGLLVVDSVARFRNVVV